MVTVRSMLFAAPIPVMLAGAAGCSAPAALIATAPEYAPKDQAKCGIVKNQAEPLIVEWPAAQRTKLEALSRRGAVAVKYLGCDLEVLAQCRVSKTYVYTSTTKQRERVTIRNEDELYARLPIGAVRLEADLKKAGELNVSMTIVGTYETDRAIVHRDELAGECDGATHVVTALTVGAFEFTAGADVEGGAGATVAGTGAGVRGSSRRETLNEAGDEASCERATAEDQVPPYGCGALLRLEVFPIWDRRAPSAAAVKPTIVEPAAVEPPIVEPAIVGPAAVDPSAVKPTLVEPATKLPVEPSPTAELPRTEPAPRPDLASPPPVTSPAPYEQPPPPAPVAAGSTTPYVVVAVVLGALLVAGVIIGAVVASNNDDATMGSTPNNNGVSYTPVWRW